MTSFTSFLSSNPPDPTNNIFTTTGSFDGSMATGGSIPFGTIDTSLLPDTIWISLPNEMSCDLESFQGGVFIQCSPTNILSTTVQQVWTFSSLTNGTSKWAYIPNLQKPASGMCTLSLTWASL